MRRKQLSGFRISVILFTVVCPSLSASARANLLVYYAFNEGAGDTVRDMSGNGNDAKMHNMNDSAWVVSKEERFGTCLALDGSDDYVKSEGTFSQPLDGDFTLSMWFTATPGRRARLFTLSSANEKMINIRIVNDIIRIDDSGGVSSEVSGDVNVTDRQWHHIAAVRDGQSLTVYLDGEQHLEASLGSVLTMDNVSIAVRSQSDGSRDDFLLGNLDEFRIYTEAFDADRIETLMVPGGTFTGASGPNPKDGAIVEDTWANLSWVPGDFAVSHDVYISDSFDDVNNGAESAFRGNQTLAFIIVGLPGFPYPDGLATGSTYYWRIDEVDETEPNSPWKGNVWSFVVPSKTAYFPEPADGAEAVAVDVQLSWTPGSGSKLHTVYFGDNFEDVYNATGGQARGTTTFTPGILTMAKTYYWRVDEFDLIETHKGDVWSFTTEGALGSPNPTNGAVDMSQTSILSWVPGVFADTHEIYFGIDKDAVKNADASSPEYKGSGNLGSESYDPGQLEWNTTYHWRIIEVNNANADSPWKGPLWSFTTGNFLVVDDFESYNDLNPTDPESNRIFNAWLDGFGDATNGSLVGYDDPPLTEQTIVHSGSQSMPFAYDNAAGKSEATLTLTDMRDWTVQGVDRLTIWYIRGSTGNDVEKMYVVLNGTAVVTNDNPNASAATNWSEWNIDLQAFTDQGVDLANINTITLGFGNRNNPVAGGTGLVIFDDIRLYPPAP
ncbi:MAG: LamG domain-containing protein [Planctomycetota bacterium]|jgi:hypothetical protein